MKGCRVSELFQRYIASVFKSSQEFLSTGLETVATNTFVRHPLTGARRGTKRWSHPYCKRHVLDSSFVKYTFIKEIH